MILSREAEYAIQTVLYLAQHKNDNEFIFIRNVAEKLDIPFFYLSKILLKLVKAGILHSHKGPKGGVKFATDPGQISLYEVIRVVDGEGIFSKCVLGLPQCDSENPCAVHAFWGGTRGQIAETFRNQSIAQLAQIHLKPVKLKL